MLITPQIASAKATLIQWWRTHGSRRTLRACLNAIRTAGLKIETIPTMAPLEFNSLLRSKPLVSAMHDFVKRVYAIAREPNPPEVAVAHYVLKAFLLAFHPRFVIPPEHLLNEKETRALAAAKDMVVQLVEFQERPEARFVLGLRARMHAYLFEMEDYVADYNRRLVIRTEHALKRLHVERLTRDLDAVLLAEFDRQTVRLRAIMTKYNPEALERLDQDLEHMNQ